MDLYKYSPRRDKIIVRLGIFFSILSGACIPLYAIVIGKIVGMFDPTLEEDEKKDALGQLIWIVILISVLSFVAAYLSFSLMQISAERVAFTLRKCFLASLMK